MDNVFTADYAEGLIEEVKNQPSAPIPPTDYNKKIKNLLIALANLI